MSIHISERLLGVLYLVFRLFLVSLGFVELIYLDALFCLLLCGGWIFSRHSTLALLLLASVLAQASEPSVGLFPAIWFSLIPVYFVINTTFSLRRLFWYGMFWGMLLSTGIFAWLFEAMVIFWEAPAALVLPVFTGTSLLLALPYAVFMLLSGYVRSKTRLPVGLIAPVLFALVEFWTPYPVKMYWALAQCWVPALIQVSDIAGISGVSLLIAAVNGFLFEALCAWRSRLHRKSLSLTAGALGVVCLQLIYGLFCLRFYAPREDDQSVRVALIQPVSPLKVLNSDDETKAEIARTLLDLSVTAVRQSSVTPDMLIWPEGAAPMSIQSPGFNPEFLDTIREFQALYALPLLVQDIEFSKTPRESAERIHYFNHVSMVGTDGTLQAGYRKNRLLPLAEYLPGENSLPFVRRLFPQARSVMPGSETELIEGPGGFLVPLICYEVVFSEFVRTFVARGGNYIVNLTNDRWYGTRQQPYQHLAFAAFRAVENRKPLIRATNSGISAFIDCRGIIRKDERTRVMQAAALSASVYPGRYKSLYGRTGDLLLRWILTPVALVTFTLRLSSGARSKERRKA